MNKKNPRIIHYVNPIRINQFVLLIHFLTLVIFPKNIILVYSAEESIIIQW